MYPVLIGSESFKQLGRFQFVSAAILKLHLKTIMPGLWKL